MIRWRIRNYLFFIYHKSPKFSDTENLAVIFLKINQSGITCTEDNCPKKMQTEWQANTGYRNDPKFSDR